MLNGSLLRGRKKVGVVTSSDGNIRTRRKKTDKRKREHLLENEEKKAAVQASEPANEEQSAL